MLLLLLVDPHHHFITTHFKVMPECLRSWFANATPLPKFQCVPFCSNGGYIRVTSQIVAAMHNVLTCTPCPNQEYEHAGQCFNPSPWYGKQSDQTPPTSMISSYAFSAFPSQQALSSFAKPRTAFPWPNTGRDYLARASICVSYNHGSMSP